MHLETRVAGLQKRRIVAHQKLVHAVEPELERGAQQVFLDGGHQVKIPLAGCQVVHLEVVLSQRRQDATKDDRGIVAVQDLLDFVEIAEVFLFEVAQAMPRELLWREVYFQIELGQLGHAVVLLAQLLQNLHIYRRRFEGFVVHEAHLLFGTDAGDIGLEPIVFEHVLERLDIAQQRPHKLFHHPLVGGHNFLDSHIFRVFILRNKGRASF